LLFRKTKEHKIWKRVFFDDKTSNAFLLELSSGLGKGAVGDADNENKNSIGFFRKEWQKTLLVAEEFFGK